ncbi:lipid A export permease/ATP-binding protein MsbA [Pleionea sediminis]|uniref:lipid A export permease/ATP-binding protein MsbA n=1 Tax=Pleionea sediminis TaxID=2569479 RepID=UPI0013DDA63D|nr:lipid A export permease/ATP-binding protein MsbA [Pleionea sediminis]
MSKPTGWQIYKRLLKYTSRYKTVFFIGLFCTAISALIEVGLIAQFETLIDDLLAAENIDILRWTPVILIVILIVRGLATFFSTYCMEWIGRRIVHELRTDLFNKYLYLPIDYFEKNNSGDLVSRITFNTETVSNATTQAVTNLIRSLAGIIGALTYMFLTSVTLTLTFLIAAPLIAIVVNVTAKRFRRISHNMQDSMGLVTQSTQETVEGIRVVKTFSGESYEKNKFFNSSNKNRQQAMKMVTVKAFSSPLIQVLAGMGMAIVFWVAVEQFLAGTLTKGSFVAFFMQIMYMLKPLKDLSNVNNVLQRGIAGAESIFHEVDKSNEINQGTLELERSRGRIEFDNVCFAYDDKGPVLNNVSLNIESGQTVAIVGPSGSGKSTLTNLLLKFYHPSSGQIRLDGNALDDIELNSLREQFAYVSQQIVLFNDTIKANIAYGELAKCDEEALNSAIENAYLTEVIDSFDDGLNTMVGTSGSKLSGGQRQRVAIARALLKDAPILVLDEATSALDNESEKKIQLALENLMKDRTTIVIAHRLSTVENADKIVVLKEGKIVEQGKHADLLSQQGEYYRLYQMQFSED